MAADETFVMGDTDSSETRRSSDRWNYGLVPGVIVRSIVVVAWLTAAMVAMLIAEASHPAEAGFIDLHHPFNLIEMARSYALRNLPWGVAYAFVDGVFRMITRRYLTRAQQAAIFIACLGLAATLIWIYYLSQQWQLQWQLVDPFVALAAFRLWSSIQGSVPAWTRPD